MLKYIIRVILSKYNSIDPLTMGYMGSDNIVSIVICALIYSSTTVATTNLNMNVNITTDDLTAQSHVDILIIEYFKTEKMLWHLIDTRADNVLVQVFKAHEKCFDKVIDHSGSGVLSRELIPNIETLIRIGSNVNSTTEMGQMHLKEQTLDQQSITEYSTFALKILKDASNLFDYATNDTLWENIITHLSNCHNNGDTVHSSHQVVYDLYRDIQSGLLKSFITAQFSYMILGYYNSGENYGEQVDILRSTFRQRFGNVRQIARRFLKKSQKIVWKCDTIANNAFSSYTEISNFLQGFVDNEANLNSGASCAGECSDHRKTFHFQCQSGSLCDRHVNDHEQAKCNGIIRDCQDIDDSDVNICETGEPNRRYNYIKYSDGRIAGNSNARAVCHGRLRAESWIRWFVRCSNCICLCDDIKSKRTERYFSLHGVVSNIADNKIVTGVGLRKQNSIIHLVISERSLLPYGQAETTSDHSFYEPWKSSDEFFNIYDSNIEENVDYVTLTYENRSINLDMVTVPEGTLVTGVRFRRVTNTGHITLDVRATAFDFITGKLKDLSNSVWISNPNCGQTEITLQRPTSPLNHSNELSQINTTPNAFIKFGPTDYWSDVMQLTVPFIDTQRVEPYNPIALSGIGLYHKSTPKSGSAGKVADNGGFIAPKLIVYDFESYILNDAK